MMADDYRVERINYKALVDESADKVQVFGQLFVGSFDYLGDPANLGGSFAVQIYFFAGAGPGDKLAKGLFVSGPGGRGARLVLLDAFYIKFEMVLCIRPGESRYS